jgi:hypothetical protein
VAPSEENSCSSSSLCRYPPHRIYFCRYILTYLTRVRILCTAADGASIKYLLHIKCVSIYVWWVHYRSLCIAYDVRTPFFLQMSLTQKFKDAFSGTAVHVTALFIGTRYLGIHCERVDTKFGPSVRLILLEDAEDNMIRVFLPRHYGASITDNYIPTTNYRKIQYYLTYKGKSATTNRPVLQMDLKYSTPLYFTLINSHADLGKCL